MAFQRTLRVPEGDGEHPLPPGLGRLPVVLLDGRLLVPLRQGEALWLAFDGEGWPPNAVQVAVGGVNAVSGGPFGEGLRDDPQNYLVTPDQPWLDGINSGDGTVRQFVAVPLGSGASVEGQVTGTEERGGLQLRVFDAKPGRFGSEPPPPDPASFFRPMASASAGGMGLGAGGRLRQRVPPDPYGLDTWDQDQSGEIEIEIVNSEEFQRLTRCQAPPSPVSAQLYTEYGLPWFELYDVDVGDLTPPAALAGVKGVEELSGETSEFLEVDPSQVVELRRPDPPG